LSEVKNKEKEKKTNLREKTPTTTPETG